ncbi:MAG: hypothetical protein WCS94_20580 [Verrucomicrobiota bacterium]
MIDTRCLAAGRGLVRQVVARILGQCITAMLPMREPFLIFLKLALMLARSASAATLISGFTAGSGLLGSSLINDNAATGGGAFSSSTGDLGWPFPFIGLKMHRIKIANAPSALAHRHKSVKKAQDQKHILPTRPFRLNSPIACTI